MLVLIWCLVLVASVMLYFRQRYSWFRRAGVGYITPIPPFGNSTRSIFKLEHLIETFNHIYHAFPGHRFFGFYEFLNPIVVIKDPDLIKKVTLKDFDHFTDHRSVFDGDLNDDFFGKGLLLMKGGKWKDMRSTLSPAFTSSKIKLMVPFVIEVGEQMNQVLNDKIKKSEEKYIDLEVRDLTTRYANDVIASSVFGIKINSHSNQTNEFYVNGSKLTDFKIKGKMFFKMLGFVFIPKVMNKLNITFFSREVTEYFKNIIKSVMRDREEHNIIRHDMIHLLMEAKRGSLSHNHEVQSEDTGFATVEESTIGKTKNTRVWREDDLEAQAILFFLAGFDTVSTVMTLMLYELARNPEAQDKLVCEIREMEANNKKKFDFNSIQEMPYLDMVVSETLRMYPPLHVGDRICVKDYNLGRGNCNSTKDYIIRKGETVFLPGWAIHRDPQYYSDPDKFIPERFSKENRHNIKPFTYLPFGVGPRNCIGSRFALCELKVMAYQLLKDFELSPNERTTIPFELAKDNFNARLKGGHWLRLKLRT